jgi:hypothetical protein
VRSKLVQQRPNVVDQAGMVSREQLERQQRRASASGALVLDAASQQLGLLPVAELSDCPIGDCPLAVVLGSRRALELVLPLRPQVGKLTLRALLRERGPFRGG